MTLIELVVVLGILAGVATLALTSLGGLGASQRRDTSERIIDQIEQVIGTGVDTGRFVSDMGRLPVLHGHGNDGSREPGRGLMELWDDCASLDTGGTYNGYANAPDEINFDEHNTYDPPNLFSDNVKGIIPGGWQGPYIDMGGDKLFDGFGNNLRFWKGSGWYSVDDVFLDDQDEVLGVAAFGSDDAQGGGEWEEEDIKTDNSTANAHLSAELYVSIKVRSHNLPYPWVPCDNGTWVTKTSYDAGDIARDAASGKGDLYVCDNATCTSTLNASNGWRKIAWCNTVNRMRVMLFMPYAEPDPTTEPPVALRTIWAGNDGNTNHRFSDDAHLLTLPDFSIWNPSLTMQSMVLKDLPPGLRALFVYGYMGNSSNWANAFSSGLQTIDLKPGVNHITVYLDHPL